MRYLMFLLCLAVATPVWAASSQDFNATTSDISCGSETAIDDVWAGGGTVAAWIYADNVGEASLGRMYSKTQNQIFICASSCTNARQFQFEHAFSGNDGKWHTGNGIPALDTWEHWAIVYNSDATTNDPIFYRNGSTVSITENTTPTLTADSDAGSDLVIGNNAAAGIRTWDGSIIHFHYYNRSLTATEVNEIMFHPGQVADGLVLYVDVWNATMADLSGSGNTCTGSNLADSTLGSAYFLADGLPL